MRSIVAQCWRSPQASVDRTVNPHRKKWHSLSARDKIKKRGYASQEARPWLVSWNTRESRIKRANELATPTKKPEKPLSGILKKSPPDVVKSPIKQDSPCTISYEDLQTIGEILWVRSPKFKSTNKHKIAIVKSFIYYICFITNGHMPSLTTWGVTKEFLLKEAQSLHYWLGYIDLLIDRNILPPNYHEKLDKIRESVESYPTKETEESSKHQEPWDLRPWGNDERSHI